MTYTKRVIPITDEDVFRVGGTFYGDNSSDEYGFEEDDIYWLNNKCTSLALNSWLSWESGVGKVLTNQL